MFLILLLSLIPIWCGAFFVLAIDEGGSGSYISQVFRLIKSGELVLYATSMLAPIFYLVINSSTHGEEDKKYPDTYFQGAVILVLLIISLIIFIATRVNPNKDFVFNWSLVIYFASVSLLYMSMVFRNWMNDQPDLRHDEQDFVKRYQSRRGS